MIRKQPNCCAHNAGFPLLFAALLGFWTTSPALATPCQDGRGIVASGADLKALSGYYVGGDQCFYDPNGIQAIDVPPAVGASGLRAERLVFVNGANPQADREPYFLTLLAQARDTPAIGVLNTQTSDDPFSTPTLRGTSAVKTLESLMLESLETRREVIIRAGSGGALPVAVAVARAKGRWAARHHGPRRLDEALRQLRIETFGGVGAFYPDGPRYVHYANLLDPNAQKFGVLNPLTKPGHHAVIAIFRDSLPPLEANYESLTPENERILSHHGFGVYNAHQVPFDRIYRLSLPVLPYTVVPFVR